MKTYRDYLNSAHWKQKRKEALRYGGRECWICKSTKDIQIHHRTYKRKGRERIETDLFALCAKHHKEVHERAKGKNLWNETTKLKKEYVERNGFVWGKREINEYFKTANKNNLKSIKKLFY